ncbi:MAG: hypothetical protein AAFQ66_11095 [Pseudomonadota bacterium]
MANGKINYPRTVGEASLEKRFGEAFALAVSGCTDLAHARLLELIARPDLPAALREQVVALLAGLERREAEARLAKLRNQAAVAWRDKPVKATFRTANEPQALGSDTAAPSSAGAAERTGIGALPSKPEIFWTPEEKARAFPPFANEAQDAAPSLANLHIQTAIQGVARFRGQQLKGQQHGASADAAFGPAGPDNSLTFTRAAALAPDDRALEAIRRETSEKMGDATAFALMCQWLGVGEAHRAVTPTKATGAGSAQLWQFPDGRWIYRAGSKNRVDFVSYCPRKNICYVIEAKGQSSTPGYATDKATGEKVSQADLGYVGVKAAQMAAPSPSAKDAAFVGEVGATVQRCLAEGRVIYQVVKTQVGRQGSAKISVLANYDLGGRPAPLGPGWEVELNPDAAETIPKGVAEPQSE